MKVSSHEEYGLRCMLQLARCSDQRGLTIPAISQAEKISTHYVGKLMSILRRGGLIKSTRGQVGGYKLARSADRISVADVLAVLGGRLYDAEFCSNHTGNSEDCRHSTDCAVRALWKTVQESIDRVLARTTLRDLIRSEDEMTSWINIAPHLERADQPGSRR